MACEDHTPIGQALTLYLLSAIRSVRKETEDVLDLMSVLMRVLYPLMILVSVVLMHVSFESCLMYALMILVAVVLKLVQCSVYVTQEQWLCGRFCVDARLDDIV